MRRKCVIAGTGLFILTLSFLVGVVFVPCFSLGEKILCQGPADHPWIALTFDDGPNEPYTRAILDILKDEQITATFFIVGKYAAEYPETVQRIAREGHAIGNHTMTHAPLIWASPDAIADDISNWENIVMPLIGPQPTIDLLQNRHEQIGCKAGWVPQSGAYTEVREHLWENPTQQTVCTVGYARGLMPKLFRSPHGWKNPFLTSVLAQNGYTLIGWTHGVWDSARPGEAVLLRRLRRAGENGAIILLHDGDGDHAYADRSQTVHALKKIIPYYRSRGFRFVTIPEILATNP